MEWSKQPPQILHSEPRPANYQQMIQDAARNIHLRKQSVSLLICYASHANTFRPAAKLITQQTGIAKQDISKVRKRLVERGLIAYRDYPGFILIDWNRVRIFARLQEPLQLHLKEYSFAPVSISQSGTPFPFRETIGQQGKRYRIREPRPLSDEEKRFFAVLEQMTEDEYFEMVEGIRRDEFPTMPEPPSREKTALHNKESKYQFIPDEPEETALQNKDIFLPQIETYQLPF